MTNDITSLKFCVLCICLLFLNIANPAFSAWPDGLHEEDPSFTQKNNRHKSGASVQKVQAALANIGFVLKSLSKFDEAILYFNKAIKKNQSITLVLFIKSSVK